MTFRAWTPRHSALMHNRRSRVGCLLSVADRRCRVSLTERRQSHATYTSRTDPVQRHHLCRDVRDRVRCDDLQNGRVIRRLHAHLGRWMGHGLASGFHSDPYRGANHPQIRVPRVQMPAGDDHAILADGGQLSPIYRASHSFRNFFGAMSRHDCVNRARVQSGSIRPAATRIKPCLA